MPWIDRGTGQPVRITTAPIDGLDRPGTVRVRTYRDILLAYATHPENKSLGPQGRPVGRATRGLLQRRPVEGVRPFAYIGKEGNRIEDRALGLVTRPEDYRTEYQDAAHDMWATLVRPVLATIGPAELVDATGLHRRSIERLLCGMARPGMTTGYGSHRSQSRTPPSSSNS